MVNKICHRSSVFSHLFLLQGQANNVNIIIIPTRKMVYLLECSGPRICIQFLFPPCIVQHDSNLISFHFRTHSMSQHQFKLFKNKPSIPFYMIIPHALQ